MNDTTWSAIARTWRPGGCELYVGTSTGWSRVSSNIYRFWTSQNFNGNIALIACSASSWTPAMVRRWHADPFGFLRPWNELPALFGSAPPRNAVLDRHRAWSPS